MGWFAKRLQWIDIKILGKVETMHHSFFPPSSVKCITTWILFTAKLNGRWDLVLKSCVIYQQIKLAYLFKVNLRSTRVRLDVNCSRLRAKTVDQTL